jgi:hypothetical protein
MNKICLAILIVLSMPVLSEEKRGMKESLEADGTCESAERVSSTQREHYEEVKHDTKEADKKASQKEKAK